VEASAPFFGAKHRYPGGVFASGRLAFIANGTNQIGNIPKENLKKKGHHKPE